MSDLISRQEAINEFYHIKHILQMMDDSQNADKIMQGLLLGQDAVKKLPPAQDRKKGKWTEKEVIHKDEAKDIIEEWQSCRCSVCGRYHTQPYLYYFDNPNYCSFCGAKMEA